MVLKRPPPTLLCGCQGGLVNVRDWRTGANTHTVFVTKLSDYTLHFFEDDDTCFPHRYVVCQSASQSDTLPSLRRLLKITIEGLHFLWVCNAALACQSPENLLSISHILDWDVTTRWEAGRARTTQADGWIAVTYRHLYRHLSTECVSTSECDYLGHVVDIGEERLYRITAVSCLRAFKFISMRNKCCCQIEHKVGVNFDDR